jgi:HAD superfamily hydrolase (TIGR01484 family)
MSDVAKPKNDFIFFFDLDGTAVESSPTSKFSDATLQLLNELNELIYCVPITTRQYIPAMRVLETLPYGGYASCASGGHIFNNKTEETFVFEKLDKVEVLQLIADLQAQDFTFFVTFDMEVGWESKELDGLVDNIDSKIGASFSVKAVDKSIKFFKDLDSKYKKLTFVESHSWDEGLADFHFLPKHVSKGFAIGQICEILNIDIADTIAIGDGLNDMSMRNANHLVAMRSAVPELKKIADEVIGNFETGGFNEYLKSLIARFSQ